jgi:hypothetical protein
MRTAVSSILLAALIFAIMTRSGCTGATEPQPARDLRSLTWTIDAVVGELDLQVSFFDIWGSSSKSVFVVGNSSGPYTKKIFHYDGLQWNEVQQTWKFGSSSVGFDFDAITGFAENDIWIVGQRSYYNFSPPPNFFDSSLVVHFDGTSWQEIVGYPKRRMLTAIGGSSPRNLWFGGVNGTLYHYDGSVVSRDSLPMKIAPDSSPFSFFLSIEGNSEENTYAIVVVPFGYPALLLVYLFKHEASGWILADQAASGFTDLWMSPSGNLYACDGWVYVRKGGAWQKTATASLGAYKMAGVSENNLIAVGSQGKAFHYNGVDWYQYADLVSTSIDFRGAWTDGNEVFIIGNDGWRSYIYHGK